MPFKDSVEVTMSNTSSELISVFKTFDEEGDVPIDAMIDGIGPGEVTEFIQFVESKPIDSVAFFMSHCAHLDNACREWLLKNRDHESDEVSYWCSAGLLGSDSHKEGLDSIIKLSERAYKAGSHQLLFDIVEVLSEVGAVEATKEVGRLALEITPQGSSNYTSLTSIVPK